MAAAKASNNRPKSPELRAKVVAEARKANDTGDSYVAIGERHGVSSGTVGKWARDAGIANRKSGPLPKKSDRGAVARAAHRDRLKNDPEYRANVSAKISAGHARARLAKQGGGETQLSLLPGLTNGHAVTDPSMPSGDEVGYLRESLRVALREREALRVVLDIMVRERALDLSGGHS